MNRGQGVVIAAGVRLVPSTGSDGNGFELAQGLGHTIIEIFPALVQLKLEGSFSIKSKVLSLWVLQKF